jgi:hypothetical protein
VGLIFYINWRKVNRYHNPVNKGIGTVTCTALQVRPLRKQEFSRHKAAIGYLFQFLHAFLTVPSMIDFTGL